MTIRLQDAGRLETALKAWVAAGHATVDAVLIADVLGDARTLTDVMSQLSDQETRQAPRGFAIVTMVAKPVATYRLVDGDSNKILDFSLAEDPAGGHSDTRIL